MEIDEKNLLKEWEINKEKKIILMPGRLTSWKGQELFIEAINLTKIELGYEAFHVVILGSDQGREINKKKLTEVNRYRIGIKNLFAVHLYFFLLIMIFSDISLENIYTISFLLFVIYNIIYLKFILNKFLINGVMALVYFILYICTFEIAPIIGVIYLVK